MAKQKKKLSPAQKAAKKKRQKEYMTMGGLERVIIWGSFVSNKELPHDIDLLLIMKEDFNIDKANPDVRKIFDYAQGRIAFNADIFWTKSSIGEDTINLWLETYQMTRDFKPRGIVEVIINDKK